MRQFYYPRRNFESWEGGYRANPDFGDPIGEPGWYLRDNSQGHWKNESHKRKMKIFEAAPFSYRAPEIIDYDFVAE